MTTQRDFSRVWIHIDQQCRECGGHNIFTDRNNGITVPEELVCPRCGGYGNEHSFMTWDELVQEVVKSIPVLVRKSAGKRAL